MGAADIICMAVLKLLLSLFIVLFSYLTQAEVALKKTVSCASTDEFIATYEFLKTYKEISIAEDEKFKISTSVSKNCTGASLKFQKILKSLIQTGVDYDRAVRFSIEFSNQSAESIDAFLSLFEGFVSQKKFNLAYYEAFKLAQDFSKNSEINHKILKDEFMSFLSFCFEDPDGLQVPFDECRQIAVKYIAQQKKYPEGLFADFKKLFKFLKEDKFTGYSISQSLKTTLSTLDNGPMSATNFIKAYNYSLHDLGLKPSHSLQFAIKMAEQSKARD